MNIFIDNDDRTIVHYMNNGLLYRHIKFESSFGDPKKSALYFWRPIMRVVKMFTHLNEDS